MKKLERADAFSEEIEPVGLVLFIVGLFWFLDSGISIHSFICEN